MANPAACERTVSAVEAAKQLGLPEGRIPLANVIIELCLSPKSNSAMSAIDQALNDVKTGNYGEIPLRLKDAHYKGAKKLGRGVEYEYPHDFPNDWVKQQYLPDKIKNAQYYHPKNNGKIETALKEQYLRLRQSFGR